MESSKKEDINENVVVKREEGSSILRVLWKVISKAFTVSAIYLFGYYNLSVAWLILPAAFSVFQDEWKSSHKRRRELAKAAALSSEREVVLARLDDLPSWVFFPDVERAEWINTILRQLWPNVNHYAKDMIKTVVEPKIQETMTMYNISGFRFEKLRLGTIPPRIGGIKVYDKHVSRTEIMLDIDLFYAGDCDISFVMKGVPGGVKDFQIHGMMRVVLKPLISVIPLIGGVQLYFLNTPSMDFNLVGVADVLDIPGISDLLRKIVVEQVSNMMVLPNKMSFVISEAVAAPLLKTPDPEGVLRVQIVQASKLMKKDIGVLGKGKSDPYVIVSVGAQQYRSEVINNTVNPKWDFWSDFVMFESAQQLLDMRLFDYDDINIKVKDNSLGRASIGVSNVLHSGEVDTWVTLEEAKHGMVHVRLFWYEFSSELEDLQLALRELKELKATSLNTAVLVVYLDSAQHLPDAKSNVRPDPVLTITGRNVSQTTGVQFHTNSPVYEQGFSFLIHNPETDSFTIKIQDQKTGSSLGTLNYPLSGLLKKPHLKHDIEPFALQKSGPNAKILLSAQLKILKRAPKTVTTPANDILPVVGSVVTATADVDATVLDTVKNVEKLEAASPASNGSVASYGLDESKSSVHSEDTVSLHSQEGTLRKRNKQNGHHKTTSTEITGEIEMTVTYSSARQCLLVTIHKIKNLLVKDPSDLPDPYVKVYLLPKSKETKCKTKVIKDSANPVYEETFEYILSKDEIPYRQLQVTVISQKTSFISRNAALGQIVLELKELDLTEKRPTWFSLKPETEL